MTKDTMKDFIIGSAPLSEEFMREREDIVNEYDVMTDALNNRITYICERIFKCFNKRLECCYFDGAEEGEFGDFDKHVYGETFCITTEPFLGYKSLIILKDGQEWALADGIPVRWLTEDFESELTDGKKAYLEKVAAKNAKKSARAKEKASKKDKLLAEIKEKLTPEELKILKIK